MEEEALGGTRPLGGPSPQAFPRLQHDDPITTAQARHPVSDGENGPASHQTVQGVPDSFLRLAVERRGCLIEQKNGRIFEERAGNADALPLPGRQLHACVYRKSDSAILVMKSAKDRL